VHEPRPPYARARRPGLSDLDGRTHALPWHATSARAGPRAARRDDPHRCRDGIRQFQQRVGLIRTDVERLVPRLRSVDRLRHHRRHIVNVAERARLRPVAEDGHRLLLQDLIHEDADHVAIAVADILARAEDVVRPEDDVVEAEQPVGRSQLHLYRVLRNPVRVFRCRNVVFGHRRRRAAVDGNRGGEHERLHPIVDGGVQQIDAAEDVVRVVEAFDERAQAFGSVGGEVIDVIEAALREQPVDERVVHHAAADEFSRTRDVLAEPAGQVIEDGDVVAPRDERVRHVRADESGPASD